MQPRTCLFAATALILGIAFGSEVDPVGWTETGVT
jgi:hypothetical protein